MGVPNRKKTRVAPRYRFSDKDKETIRFIDSRQSRILSTVIIDISETGVGFLTSVRSAPRIGEIIKMDFAPLRSMRMACLGRVVHMVAPPQNTGWKRFPDSVKVGVEFFNLPKEYRRVLHEVLTEAFAESGRSTRENHKAKVKNKSEPTWFRENIGSIIITFLILVGTGYGIYLFSTMDPEERALAPQQSNWASQFFERTIQK